jgi:hypothetical protein
MGRAARVATCALVVLTGFTVSAGAAPQASLTLPARGAFYYPWFPETWTVGGRHVFYHPTLGYYNSSTQAVVDEHISALDYAHVDVGIASWWGVDTHSESTRIPLLLNRTVSLESPLTWTLYYEQEGEPTNPTVGQIQSDLAYVGANYATKPSYAHINGKPLIFVWTVNDSCEVADRWRQASGGAWYVVIKLFSGFRDCPTQPDGWHQYGPSTAQHDHSGYSFVISPGFWRADEPAPRLPRDLARWQQNVSNMVTSQAPWQLVTTFNEWGEGTAVEHATEWSLPPHGQYIEALHDSGGTTAVEFRTASASRIKAGVRVHWRTASESRLLGFNLYREQNGKRVRLNRAVIPSAFDNGTVARSYSWLDRRAPRHGALRYWLEAVSVSGARSWHGPIVAR